MNQSYKNEKYAETCLAICLVAATLFLFFILRLGWICFLGLVPAGGIGHYLVTEIAPERRSFKGALFFLLLPFATVVLIGSVETGIFLSQNSE